MEKQLASSLLLSSLSHRIPLTPAALSLLLSSFLVSPTPIRTAIGDTRLIQILIALLAPQEPLEIFDKSVTREIIRMDVREVVESLSKMNMKEGGGGAEKVLKPLVKRLIHPKKFTTSSNKMRALDALVSCDDTPGSVIEMITTWLLSRASSSSSTAVNEDANGGDGEMTLLEQVYQRRHTVFEKCVQRLVAEDGDVSVKERTDKLVLDFSLVRPFASFAPFFFSCNADFCNHNPLPESIQNFQRD